MGVRRAFALLQVLVLVAVTFFAGSAHAQTVVRLTSDLGIPASPDINVAAEINAAIAGAAPDTTFVFEGLYRIDTPIYVLDKQQITLQAPDGVPNLGVIRYVQGTQPTGWSKTVPYYPYIFIRNSDNVTITNLWVRGPLTSRTYVKSLERAHGVDVGTGSDYVTLKNLDIGGVHGDFINIGGNATQVRPTNVTIEGARARIAGRQAVGLTSGQFILIKSSDFRQSARTGIDIEPPGAPPPGIVSDVTVEDSLIADSKNFCFGTHSNPTYRVVFRRVQFYGCRGLGKYNADATAPHSDLVLEDVSYDYRGLELPAEPKPGSFFASNVLNLTVLRANWRFGASQPASIGGVGTVQDSVFISDKSPNPVMCLGATILSVNNTGTGACL